MQCGEFELRERLGGKIEGLYKQVGELGGARKRANLRDAVGRTCASASA